MFPIFFLVLRDGPIFLTMGELSPPPLFQPIVEEFERGLPFLVFLPVRVSQSVKIPLSKFGLIFLPPPQNLRFAKEEPYCE